MKNLMLVGLLMIGKIALANEQFPINDNEQCPQGYTKSYSGYTSYCNSNVVQKTLDTVPTSTNSCPVGYQLTYTGYSSYCSLIVCIVRPTLQPFQINDGDQCPQGYTKNYSGYTSYCNPIDTPAVCPN